METRSNQLIINNKREKILLVGKHETKAHFIQKTNDIPADELLADILEGKRIFQTDSEFDLVFTEDRVTCDVSDSSLYDTPEAMSKHSVYAVIFIDYAENEKNKWLAKCYNNNFVQLNFSTNAGFDPKNFIKAIAMQKIENNKHIDDAIYIRAAAAVRGSLFSYLPKDIIDTINGLQFLLSKQSIFAPNYKQALLPTLAIQAENEVPVRQRKSLPGKIKSYIAKKYF